MEGTLSFYRIYGPAAIAKEQFFDTGASLLYVYANKMEGIEQGLPSGEMKMEIIPYAAHHVLCANGYRYSWRTFGIITDQAAGYVITGKQFVKGRLRMEAGDLTFEKGLIYPWPERLGEKRAVERTKRFEDVMMKTLHERSPK